VLLPAGGQEGCERDHYVSVPSVKDEEAWGTGHGAEGKNKRKDKERR